jgi:hypothetical protein
LIKLKEKKIAKKSYLNYRGGYMRQKLKLKTGISCDDYKGLALEDILTEKKDEDLGVN